jgi:hypothetical protein
MQAVTATLALAALMLTGCAAVETGPSAADTRERALCEQPRGGGVWVASAGACIRFGGAG